MYNVRSRRSLVGGASLLALLLLAAAPASLAQNERQTRYAIERAQIGVSGKIIQERGGDWSSVTFDQARTQTWRVSDRQTGVRGEGRHAPAGGAPERSFTYEAVVDHRNGSIQQVSYNLTGGGGGGLGGGRDDRRVPRWLVGSFQGRSPSNRRRVALTVARSGQVSAVYDNGAREDGTYDNGRIRFNSSAAGWDVSRVGEGFRAASGRRSEVFSRTSAGDDYGDDTDDDGGRVPRWMRGTFRGTTDSGESELSIRADGTATARSLTKNQSFQGTYSDGRLRFDWGTYEVERTRDGIRTVDVNNRSSTEYRRTGN
ncbi:MAG: hypothetical protein LC795_04950 [Acidobacteria bacterium]|nr:hypothetical protein [Acidobacteriota bacterium]